MENSSAEMPFEAGRFKKTKIAMSNITIEALKTTTTILIKILAKRM
ncbi:hypothetical protein NAF17_14570 [Mucilaginibacter sp. RB4R14]|nr:hypothetical protein [Mucilaginibacter aurantiaciroseus]MCO5936764.1 hypothetical protein [Mucilaginibacter aurantiaciroseus]